MDVAIHRPLGVEDLELLCSPELARHFDLSVWMHRLKWAARREVQSQIQHKKTQKDILDDMELKWN